MTAIQYFNWMLGQMYPTRGGGFLTPLIWSSNWNILGKNFRTPYNIKDLDLAETIKNPTQNQLNCPNFKYSIRSHPFLAYISGGFRC